jgi:hypothetical protein
MQTTACTRARAAALLVASLLLLLSPHPVAAGEPPATAMEHPFRNLATWLKDTDAELSAYDPKAISRGITVLSKTQVSRLITSWPN